MFIDLLFPRHLVSISLRDTHHDGPFFNFFYSVADQMFAVSHLHCVIETMTTSCKTTNHNTITLGGDGREKVLASNSK